MSPFVRKRPPFAPRKWRGSAVAFAERKATMGTLGNAPMIDFAAVTDVGRVRSENQDRWFADPDLGLFMVADGMGGRAAGGVAVQIVAEVLPRLLGRRLQGVANGASPPDLADQASAALVELSEQLREESRRVVGLTGMGSTVVLALLHGRQAVVAHMGDSRAYLLRAGRLEQLTRDHTVAQSLVDHGELGAEAGRQPPGPRQVEVLRGHGRGSPSGNGTLRPGLRRPLAVVQRRPDGHAQRSANSGDPQPADGSRGGIRQLIDAANRMGGEDNVTAMIVAVGNGAG